MQYACLVPFGVIIDLGSPIQIYRFSSSKKWDQGLMRIIKIKQNKN